MNNLDLDTGMTQSNDLTIDTTHDTENLKPKATAGSVWGFKYDNA